MSIMLFINIIVFGEPYHIIYQKLNKPCLFIKRIIQFRKYNG